MSTGFRRDPRMSRRAAGAQGSGAAGFKPSSISGLAAWYRADLGITIGTGVSAWADQSGSGDANKNAVQATGSAQPTYNASDAGYNGRPTLSFASASSQALVTGTWSVALAQPYTIFAVGNVDGTASVQDFHADSAGSSELRCNTTGTGIGIFGTPTFLSSNAANAATKQVYGGIWNGASSSVYQSSATPVVTGSVGVASMANTAIGGITGQFVNGKIAEMVYYNSALSAAQLTSLLAYFGSRYGIVIT